jgi:hypothetical protein
VLSISGCLDSWSFNIPVPWSDLSCWLMDKEVGDGGGVRHNRLWSSSGSGWVDDDSEMGGSLGCGTLLVKVASTVLEIKVSSICPVRMAGSSCWGLICIIEEFNKILDS